MGGIQCVTPGEGVTYNYSIQRLKEMPPSDVLGSFGYIPLENYETTEVNGLKKIKVKVLTKINKVNMKIEIRDCDLLWLYAKKENSFDYKGWNSFMEELLCDEPYVTSRIICLPFVNAPASSYSTIYTVLLDALKK